MKNNIGNTSIRKERAAERKNFSKLLIQRKREKRAKAFSIWCDIKGYSANLLAAQLSPSPHPNTIYNWKKTGYIPYYHLQQLINLGFPTRDAYVGID